MLKSKKVKVAETRRLALQDQLATAASVEADSKITDAIESNPAYRKTFTQLNGELNALANQLHRKRVIVKRKAFAITVRHRRLASIPQEIETIKVEQGKVSREVALLESQEQQVVAAIKELRMKIARDLKESGDIITIPA